MSQKGGKVWREYGALDYKECIADDVNEDKYGVSWQVVPTSLPEMMTDPDPAKSEKVMSAVLQMKKLDIGELERAYAD